MSKTLEKSPLTIYHEYCDKGKLAYQVSNETVIFYPRVVSPSTGATDLQWRISKGYGTVYATTTLFPRNGDPYDVSLIDLDEGFRIMSRVEGIDPLNVEIGMRVKMRMIPSIDDQSSYPVFDLEESV